MALSRTLLAYASAAPVGANGVAASADIPENCHTIQFNNTGANTLLIGQGAVGLALAAGTNAFPLTSGQTASWAIGTQSVRGILTGATNQFIYGASGGATTVYIVYLCTAGSI